MRKITRDGRKEMHEMYKAWRAVDDLALFRDFEGYRLKEERRRKFDADGRDNVTKRAARDGDVAKLKLAVEGGAKVSGYDDDDIVGGATKDASSPSRTLARHELLEVLHVACYHARPNIVRFLLDRGHVTADMISDSGGGLAALMYTITGDGRQVRWVERGVIVERLLACSNERLARLIDDVTGVTALYSAAQVGHVQIVASLLKNGADVDRRTYDGYTALFVAANCGHIEVVRRLLKAGAEASSVCNGCPTLFAAAQNGCVEVVRLLTKAGARVSATDAQGYSALHIACVRGHIEIVSHLIECRADVNGHTADGSTALSIASQQGFAHIVSLLLRANASVNCAAKKSIAHPLHEAISKNHSNVVKLLIDAGADVNKACSSGKTPLLIAVTHGHRDIAEELIKSGADPNKISHSPNLLSPLHIAVKGGDTKTVDLLLRHGASPRHKTRKGWTPLHLAVKQGHQDIVHSLVAHPHTNIHAETSKGLKPEHLTKDVSIVRSLRSCSLKSKKQPRHCLTAADSM
eukprot:g3576.t1